MSTLEQQFDTAMFEIYRRAKAEARYNATIFLRLIADRGGLSTAKYLITLQARRTATPTSMNEGDSI